MRITLHVILQPSIGFKKSSRTALFRFTNKLSPKRQPFRCQNDVYRDLSPRIFPRVQFAFFILSRHWFIVIFFFALIGWILRHAIETNSTGM